MEERQPAANPSKPRSRNKRTSGVMMEDSNESEPQNQNDPPGGSSSKRIRREEAAGAGPSSRSDQPTQNKSLKPDAAEEKGDFVTPAVFPALSPAAPVAPGAPRILQVNQEANAEIPTPQRQMRVIPTIYQQLQLRTPPSLRGSTRLLLGRQPIEEHRGFDLDPEVLSPDCFERMSDEIILRVFHHLPRHMMCTCALVCRRWARIVCDFSLWQRMDLAGRPLKIGVLKILLERGVEVLRLNKAEIMGDFSSTVRGAPDPRRSPLSEDRMYRLQLLDMSMANVKTSLVESMLKFCPNLQKISLENIPVTDQLLINLGVFSPYLQTLNLCMCQGLTARGLGQVVENCTSLSHLNIAWTCMSREDIKDVLGMLPQQLLSLNISGNREKIKNEDISMLCERCPYLQELDISDSTELTTSVLTEIGKKLTCLQAISLSRCYGISPSSLGSLMELRELHTINIFGLMRDASLSVLERHMTHFKVNKDPFSAIARPTPVGGRSSYVWGVSSRDAPCV